MDKYIEVYAASDITFAYLMKAKLEDAGIPVQIANENLQNMYCLDGMVPRVLVPQSHADDAREIIKEIQNTGDRRWDDDYDDFDEEDEPGEFKEDQDDFEEEDFEEEEDVYD